MAERTVGFLFKSLKDCLVFFCWLHEGDGKVYLEPVISYLHQRVSKYYNWIDRTSIQAELSNFLWHVNRVYGKLVFTTTKDAASIPRDPNVDDTVDALLECLPKFFAAMYYLWYNVDVIFKGVGGGGWAEDWPGYGGGLETYLTKAYRSASGSILPGGFELRELRYGRLYANYTQGKKMTTDLRWFLDKKVEQNYLRDVFILSTCTVFGAESVNTANAICLVGVFCDIVKSGKQDALKEALEKNIKPKCIAWDELKHVCGEIKVTYNNMFTTGPFDHSGVATTASYLRSEVFAEKFAAWFRTNFTNIIKHVETMRNQVIDTGAFNYRSFANGVLFPNGVVFKGNDVVQAKGFLDTWEWTNALETFVDDNSGLPKLKELLDGVPCPQAPLHTASSSSTSGAKGTRSVVGNKNRADGSQTTSGAIRGKGGGEGASHSGSGAKLSATQVQSVAQSRTDSTPSHVQASTAQRTTQSQPKSAPQNAGNSDSKRVEDTKYTGGGKSPPAPSVSVPQNHATSSTITVQKPDIPSLSTQAKADHIALPPAPATLGPSSPAGDLKNHVDVLPPTGKPDVLVYSSIPNEKTRQSLSPRRDAAGAADTHATTHIAAVDGGDGIGGNGTAGETGRPGESDSAGRSESPFHAPPAHPQPLPADSGTTTATEASMSPVTYDKVPVESPNKPEVPPAKSPGTPITSEGEQDQGKDPRVDVSLGSQVQDLAPPSPPSGKGESVPTGSPGVNTPQGPTSAEPTVSYGSSNQNSVQDQTVVVSQPPPTGDAVSPGSPSRSIRQGVGLNGDAHSGKQLVSSPSSEPPQSSNGQAQQVVQLQGPIEPSTSIPAPPGPPGDQGRGSQGGASSGQQPAVSTDTLVAQSQRVTDSVSQPSSVIAPSAVSVTDSGQGDSQHGQQSGISNATESDSATTTTPPSQGSVPGDGGASGSGGDARGSTDGDSKENLKSIQAPTPSDSIAASTSSVGSGLPGSPGLTPISSPQENSHDQGADKSAKSTTVSEHHTSDLAGGAVAAVTKAQQIVDNEGNGSEGQPGVAPPVHSPPPTAAPPSTPETIGPGGAAADRSTGRTSIVSQGQGIAAYATNALPQPPSAPDTGFTSFGTLGRGIGPGLSGRGSTSELIQRSDQSNQTDQGADTSRHATLVPGLSGGGGGGGGGQGLNSHASPLSTAAPGVGVTSVDPMASGLHPASGREGSGGHTSLASTIQKPRAIQFGRTSTPPIDPTVLNGYEEDDEANGRGGDLSKSQAADAMNQVSIGQDHGALQAPGRQIPDVSTSESSPFSTTNSSTGVTQFSRTLHTTVNLDSLGSDTEQDEDTGGSDDDSGVVNAGTDLHGPQSEDVSVPRGVGNTGSSMSKDAIVPELGGLKQSAQDGFHSGSPTGSASFQAVVSQHLNPQSSSTISSGRGPATVSPAPIAFDPPTTQPSKSGPSSPAPLSPVSESNEQIDKHPVTLGGGNDEDPKTDIGSFGMPSTGEPPGINGGGSSVGTGQGGTNPMTPQIGGSNLSLNTSVNSGSNASHQVPSQVLKQTPAAITFTKITDDQIWELQKQSMHGENYKKLQQKIKQRSDAKQRSQIIPNLKKHVYHTDSYASDARSGGFTRFSPQHYVPQKGQQKPAVRNDVIINGDAIEDPFYENDRKQRERVVAEAKRKEDVRQMKQTTDESTWMAEKLKFADEVKEHKLNVTKILQDIKQKDLDLMQSPQDFNCIVVSDTSKAASDDLYGKVVHELDGKAMTYDNVIQDPEEKRMEDLYNRIMEDYRTEDNTRNVMEKMKEEHRKEIEKFNREAEKDYNVAVEQNRIVHALANSISLDDASSIPLMENMTPSMSFLAEFDGSATADARGSSPMLPLPQSDFDIEMAYKPDRSDDNDGFRNHPPPAAAYKINAPLSYNYPDISSSSPYLETFDEESLKSPTVDFCLPAWTTHTPTDDFDGIPEIELFPAEAPRTIRDMLRWLVGIGSQKHLTTLDKCINEAFGKAPDVIPGNPTLCVNNSKLKSEDVIKALKLASMFSSSVLSAIEPGWKQKSSRSGTVKRMDTDHDQDPDGCALLCCLQDYVYACYHQLAFLRSQCAGDKFRGGWMGCQFGRDVTAESPLQAFLTDAYYSKFKTHLFDPCDVCLKSRIRMGFRKGDFSKIAKDGSYLYYLLSPSCSGDDDPLITLSSYLNCITRRTPRTTGELVSFFQHFGSEMRKDGIGILSDMGRALSTPHPNCPEWDHLGRHDLDAVGGIRVSESPISKHDNDHAGTLSTLVGCNITNVQCTKLLSPITHRAYAMYSPCFAQTYLSWVVYLADTLRESLDRLRYDFTRHNVSKCGSIHHCHDALPYLYFHGFTPPEGTSTSLVTCSQVITKLEEVINGGPIAKLINCMDDFLYRVRWPFIYTVITLWSTAFLLFAHTALYRLDLLRIQSHFLRSRGSHVIDVKALLTDGTKMPSLYDIDYFDDEALAHAWNRIY
ncbi:hypothetical protein BBBOND_0406090 [Babesia bigemina]|uniref:Ribosome-binding protein 1 n=1 Tax=Babesia bigemina TaxID=5866 RepID=A0A061DEZ2_BABBI|nr:hypothetical protein BBBOND_0406090 [Babesia bigemina]CDR98125.1 hypothetical protein BBBOND_0406090 [Babesia bigemina]|eukprot:XP_012770311.1 hypothetical protein BBBOND_0406090 [Babesia bigemina]